MNVAALCVSPEDITAGLKSSRIAAEFQHLETRPYLGTSVVPPAFEDEPMPAGVHLHWALPDALTRSDSGAASGGLREAPNRFLVVRLAVMDDGSFGLERKAWVIDGDHVWSAADGRLREKDPRNALSRTVPLVYPARLDSMLNPTYAYQGRVRPLDDRWSDDATRLRQPFTALGYGTEAYAAAYPHCRNVFGFFDPCNDADQAPDGLGEKHRYLSYLVVGWHADPALDPLRHVEAGGPGLSDDAFAAALAASWHWSYSARDLSRGPGAQASGLPAGDAPVGGRRPERTLYVGQVTRIEWRPKDALVPRRDEPIGVALGTTISEALSALLANTQGRPAETEALLNDLQFDLLSRYASAAGQASLAEERHLRDFAPLPAGHVSAAQSGRIWVVKRAGAGQPGDAIDGVGETKLPPPLARALRALNGAQAAHDELAAALATRRGQLFADWTTYLSGKNEPAKGYLGEEIESLDQLLADLAGKTRARDEARSAVLDRLRQAANPAFELDSVAAPRFYRPNDPVILLSGVDPSSRYGGDGRFDPGRLLVCRLSDQVTRWANVPRKMSADERARLDEILDAGRWAKFLGPALPRTDDLVALCIEASLLDPWLGKHLERRDHPFFVQQQEAYLGGARAELRGVPPSVIGLTAHEQPWIPLMLQWQASFRAFPHGDGTRPYPAGWGVEDFTLSPAEPDIRFTGADPGFEPADAASYEGTVTLTNNVQLNLVGQIERYLGEHPADSASDTPATVQTRQLLGAIKGMPFRMMAQAMDGLHQQMLMRGTTLQMPVLDPPTVSIRAQPDLKSAITEALFFSDRVREAVDGERYAGALGERRQFHPLRAGLLQVTRLRLVDAFGQFRDLLAPAARSEVAPTSVVVLPARLKPPRDWQSAAALLPLRIAQPARLSFRYRAAHERGGASSERGAGETDSDAGSSPVIGWILHNRFDRALALYDEGGRPIGSFCLNGPAWQEAPGPNTGVAGPRLLEFMQHLGGGWAATDRGEFQRGFLDKLLDTIDRAVSGIDVDGYPQDQGLAVLVGRPLALVQADLRLDLYGSLPADDRRQAGLPGIDQGHDAFMIAVARSRTRPAGHAGYDERTRRSAGIESVRFPVRLGDDAKVHDGLVGYFVQAADPAETYRSFHAPSATPGDGPSVVKPALSGAGCLSLAAGDATPTRVIMLVDPRAPVHATSGVLPVKSITLPPQHYAEALRRIDATFLVAPVLGGAAGVALPVPDESGHAWSWLTRHADETLFDEKGAGVRKWATQGLVEPPHTRASFSAAPLRLREGWLRLYPSIPKPGESAAQTAASMPTPYDVIVEPDAAGDLVLAPETATLRGNGITVAEVDDGTRFIGYWRDDRDEVSWTVRAHGGYVVDVRCSAPLDSQFDIDLLNADGERIWTQRHRVRGAAWSEVRRPEVMPWNDVCAWVYAVPLAWFGLEPGVFEVRVRPARQLWVAGTNDVVDKPWHPINLWSLGLSKRVEADAPDIHLRSWLATLHGERIRHLNVAGAVRPENSYIGGWTAPADFATWRVRLGVGAWQLRLDKRHIRLSEANDTGCEVAVEVRQLGRPRVLASARAVFAKGRHRLHVCDLATEEPGDYEVKVSLVQGSLNLDAVVLDAGDVVTMDQDALVLAAERARIVDDAAGGVAKVLGADGRQHLRLTPTGHAAAAGAAWIVDLGDRSAGKVDLDLCLAAPRGEGRVVIEVRELNEASPIAEVTLACEATGGPEVFRVQSFPALQLALTQPKRGRYELRIRLEDPAGGAPVHVQSITLWVPA